MDGREGVGWRRVTLLLADKEKSPRAGDEQKPRCLPLIFQIKAPFGGLTLPELAP